MLETILKIWKTGKVTKYRTLPTPPAERRGRIALDTAVCVVCGNCQQACPTGALTIGGHPGEAAITVDYSRCLFCGLCVASCGNQGLTQTNDLYLAETNKKALQYAQGGDAQ